MTTELRLPGSIAEIDASPKGPQIGAFFDLDGTLIAGYSARYLTQDRLRRREFGGAEIVRSLALIVGNGMNEDTFAELIELGGKSWRGRAVEDLDEMGLRIFENNISDLIYPEMRDIVEAHQRRGHTVVLSSSASSFQAEPVAKYLGIDDVLCNRFVSEDGVITGEVQRPVLWGPGKANAVQTFAADRTIDLDRSYFYADGDEDLALMYLVGHPRPTNPGKQLAQVAHKRGWPVLQFTSRGTSGLVRTGRMVAGLGAMVPIAWGGLAVGLARRDKRAGLNFFWEHFLDLSFAVNQVKINVLNEENAWAQRPAVFLVNHRNTFDGMVAMKVVRTSWTAVAKGEIGDMPVLGAIGRFMDVAYVDRSNTESAVASLKELEVLTEKGLSVLIAPEGTRVDTKQVAPFKKGAFRIAMASGLPIVPIVVRNVEAIGGRNSFTMHPGTVDVAVLEPISVADWKLDELAERIEEVRQLYLDTLANWPANTART